METFKREIFEELGNLFYALAADQQISLMESGELKMLLRKDWLTEIGNPSKDKVSEAAHIIGLTIDSLQNEKVSSDETYSSFAKFYFKHREQFSFALKENILRTAGDILRIFPSEGKQNDHFRELQMLFEHSPQTSQVKA